MHKEKKRQVKMNQISRTKRNSKIIQRECGTTPELELEELEQKACLFYKLAVVKDIKCRFRTYRSVFVGKEMVDSMVGSGLAESRQQAVELGRAIAETFNLFRNCDKTFLRKHMLFEDEPNSLYRFTSGALMLISKMDEEESSVPDGFGIAACEPAKRAIRGPGIQRQSGTRTIKAFTSGIKDDATDDSGFDQYKRLGRTKKSTARLNLIPMDALIEESSNTGESYGMTLSESEAIGHKVSQNKFEKPIQPKLHHRFSSPNQSPSVNKIVHKATGSFCGKETTDTTEDTITTASATENPMEDVSHLRSDRHTLLIDEFDTDVPGDLTILNDPIIPRSKMQSLQKEESAKHVFVTSPQELPVGFRRRMSDYTESFDNFGFILNKKEGNLLTKGSFDDDGQSTWTEFIIGDEEGRQEYRQNKVQQRRLSRFSWAGESNVDDVEYIVVNNVRDHEEKLDEEAFVSKLNWEPSGVSALVPKEDHDDESCMDFTVFDNTVAISYVQDEEASVAPKTPPEEDEKSLFHIFANPNPTHSGCDEDYDDEMTQITMDQALLHQIDTNHHGSLFDSLSVSTGGEVEKLSLTSKHRIQTILWKNLSSSDFSVVRLAMEELRRIVASEPKSRSHIVRMGGVMTIMSTMQKYLEQEFVQYYCCVLIELLASSESDAMKAFNEMKGIQLIVRSMQDHSDSDRVQDAGRAALATLCRMHQPAGASY